MYERERERERWSSAERVLVVLSGDDLAVSIPCGVCAPLFSKSVRVRLSFKGCVLGQAWIGVCT